ncbi:M24 family metallopeptidase [Bacillus suaedaesalsae]|uniref:Aminopeptidase P family protein n=1 Tax=Bacillus suaedaesalsae TaxID=2810349 RepID=A0ABS2DIT6_9BACI|nr:Xaa-Pro peptidase family protein [Bacillus suaedaesalsae]MBM6617471.1 aminopeptidase P family protein [Bacillus suaedaesalsae]
MSNQRIQQFISWMKAKNISAGFITSKANIFYLTKFYTDPHERLVSLLVFQDEAPILVAPNMEREQILACGWDNEIIGYSDTDNPWEFIKKAVEKRGISVQTLAIEKEHMIYQRAEKINEIFTHPTFISAEEKLHELRMIKESEEISILREAAKLADYGVEVGVNSIKEGKTELEVLATIEFELKKKGIREMSFSTMVLTGEKTAAPHGKPGLETIKNGDFVLFDLGVVLEGYCSDITRTVALGNVNDKQREIYETVLKAELDALNICKPGLEIGTIDKTARSIITNKGYGDYFTHRIGHGLGIDVHEFPSMTSTNTNTLKAGMTFTIEPGIYVPKVGGVRIEDDVLITENGFEALTKYPKELQIL